MQKCKKVCVSLNSVKEMLLPGLSFLFFLIFTYCCQQNHDSLVKFKLLVKSHNWQCSGKNSNRVQGSFVLQSWDVFFPYVKNPICTLFTECCLKN